MNYKKEAKRLIEAMPKPKESGKNHLERISKGEFLTLINLNCHGGKMTGTALAQSAEVSTARMTAILNMVEKKGYVIREADPKDRRKTYVMLTDKGKAFVDELDNKRLDFVTKYLKFLGEEDAAHLIRILEKSKSFFEMEHEKEKGCK